MYKFKFADIGEGLHEGVVGEIYKKKGDDVQEGESLFSVETDKVTSDIPSPTSGKIVDVLAKVGDTIHVGDVIYHIDDGSATSDSPEPSKEKDDKSDSKKTKEALAEASTETKVEKPIETKEEAPKAKQIVEKKSETSSLNSVKSTPLARSLASKLGINIANVTGSGTNGKILIKDIESYKKDGSQPTSTSQVSSPRQITRITEDQRIKVTGMRSSIAKAMKQSWEKVAYTNLGVEVNVTKLWNQRKEINASLEKVGKKITFTTMIAKATIIALKEFPMFNAKYDEANNEIIQFASINLGLAVDTPKGLVVPVIKNAHLMSVLEIGEEIIRLGAKARDGKLTMEDMSGGTFTLTNYGSAGALFGIPVINYPEIGILGIGIITDRVFAKGVNEFYNGKVMYLNTAADHRWVDGADIGRFTSRIKELLEIPALLEVS